MYFDQHDKNPDSSFEEEIRRKHKQNPGTMKNV